MVAIQRDKKDRKETRKETDKAQTNGRIRRRLNENILGTFVPTCRQETKRVRRAYFGFKNSGNSHKITNTNVNRFTKKRCR